MGKPNHNGPSQDGPNDAHAPPKPGWLKLQFTEAADYNRFLDFLEPENKSHIDPHNFIVARSPQFMKDSIGRGLGVFLEDASSNLHGMAVYYQFNYNAQALGEFGTTIAPLAGYKTGALIVSALSLKAWWDDNDHEDRIIAADIKKNNIGSLKLFQGLGWTIVQDGELGKTINVGSEQTLSPERQDPNLDSYDYHAAPHYWLVQNSQCLANYAKILLHYLDEGELTGKGDSPKIPIDLSALDEVGLTRDVLENIARGNLDKAQLRALGDNGSKPANDNDESDAQEPRSQCFLVSWWKSLGL